MSQTFTITRDGETETYDLLVSGMTFGEARAFEKVTGYSFQEAQTNEKVRTSTDAIQALLWVSMKRKEPTLLFGDLDDVAIDGIEFSEDEEAGPTEGEAPTSPPADSAT